MLVHVYALINMFIVTKSSLGMHKCL